MKDYKKTSLPGEKSQDRNRSVKLVLIGCGNHARDEYLPLLSKLHAVPALIVDLKSREQRILKYIERSAFVKKPEVLFLDDAYRDAEELSDASEHELLQHINRLGIKNAIIATEPKAHKLYIKFFLRHGIDTLVDKPLTSPVDASFDISRAKQIYTDYKEILDLSRQHPNVRLTINCRRRYTPAYKYIKNLLDQAVRRLQVPVTHISIYNGNGHWNMPPEFNIREDHPHKYGYGKLLHGGYHHIDLFAWFAQSNQWLEEGRQPNRIRLVQQTQGPEDLIFQIPQDLYQQFFGKKIFKDFFRTHTPEDFVGFGETEACSVIHLLRDRRVVTSGTISLVDTTVSQRSSPNLPPLESSRNFNSGLGRLHHYSINISVGPFLNVQLHSYASKARTDTSHVDDPTNPGELNHSDIYIIRNEAIVGDLPKPLGGQAFERILGADLDRRAGLIKQGEILNSRQAADRRIFMEFLEGKQPETTFEDYEASCRLLSLLELASAKEHTGGTPLVESSWRCS